MYMPHMKFYPINGVVRIDVQIMMIQDNDDTDDTTAWLQILGWSLGKINQ